MTHLHNKETIELGTKSESLPCLLRLETYLTQNFKDTLQLRNERIPEQSLCQRGPYLQAYAHA